MADIEFYRIAKPCFTVVAASDSPSIWKSRAKYVCDGNDDQEEIINALAIDNIVLLAPGTYYITSSIDVSNKTLLGCGTSTVLKIPDGFGTEFSILTATDYSYIKGILFDGNKFNVEAVPFYGITITGDRNVVCNCWFKAFTQYSIKIDGGCYNIIDNINVWKRADEGVDLRNNANYNVISNSVFASDTAYNGPGDGVHLDNSHHNTIVGNVFRYNYMYGVFLISSSYNTIVGNTFYGQKYAGISSAYGSNYNVIEGNLITDITDESSYGGIEFSGSHNLIKGNEIYNCSVNGIRINGDYNVVQGNIVRNYGNYGIKIDGTGNLVDGNDVYSTTGTAGIYDNGTDTNFGAGNRQQDGTWS